MGFLDCANLRASNQNLQTFAGQNAVAVVSVAPCA
jgi:hypothetical protein